MTLPDTLRYLSLSALDPRSDGELVAEFLATRDESTFAELLRRHGPTVYGVCRRILGDGPDADDAFQAVFLVLARKANAIRPSGMVGNWLYGVAVRTANKARVMNARRMQRDRRSVLTQASTTIECDSETLALIDTELAALPAVYRAAFVACDLNGRSRSEAARELGWPEGTVAARLAKARELLAARLRKRGITLGAATFAAVAVPTAVSAETLSAVRELLAIGTASAVVPAAQQLSEEVVKSMGTFKLQFLALGLIVMTILTCSAALVAGPGEKPGPRTERQPLANAPVPKAEKDAGLIWTHNTKTGVLTAYSPDGKKEKELTLKDGKHFLGFTKDGTKIQFVGRMGKLADVGEKDELTLHLRDINDKTEGTDTGLGYQPYDQFLPSPDGKHIVRVRVDTTGNAAAFSNTLFEVGTKKESPIDLPSDHQIMQWAEDGKAWRVMHNNLMADPKLPNYRWLNAPVDGKPKLTPICDAGSFLWLEPNASGNAFIAAGYKHPANASSKFAWMDVNPATGKATEVRTFDGVAFAILRRSPDGKRVVCLRYDMEGMRAGGTKLLAIDADGKNEQQLADFPGDEQSTRLLGWFPTKPEPGTKPDPRKKNSPVPKTLEWEEKKPITFDDGRVTSVAFSPSGKSLAVCRDNGKIDFYDPATRKHLTTMDVGGEKGTAVATATALAFAPTPHPKSGDIFAVTHKHGVKFGTVGLGIVADDAAKVDGIPPNIAAKDFDPHQLAWLTNESIVATNGVRVWWQYAEKDNWVSIDWEQPGEKGRPTLLAALPNYAGYYLEGGHTAKEANEVQITARPPASSPQTRLPGHKSRPIAAAVAKDGKRIVSADADGTLILWEGEKMEFQEKSRVELGEGVVQLALAADGKTVAVVRAFVDTTLFGTSGRTLTNLELHVFDVTDPPAKPKPLWSIRNVLGDRKANGPFSLAFNPDGKTLLAAFADPYISDKDAKSMGIKVWELVPSK